jgi:hypothetical protein
MPLYVDKLDAGIVNQEGNPVKPYKVYTALLTQTGTDVPVPTVLENTLFDNLFFEYENVGSYLLSGVDYPALFKNNKTVVFIGNSYPSTSNIYYNTAYPADEGSIRINTFIDGVLSNNATGDFVPIEIRVYE